MKKMLFKAFTLFLIKKKKINFNLKLKKKKINI